eukprot:4457227-Pleurochrysis_carterae.AAC.1
MAAPLVAGVMALVSEAYPSYSPLVRARTPKSWSACVCVSVREEAARLKPSTSGLIDAVVPSSVVSEAYLRDILKRPGALT